MDIKDIHQKACLESRDTYVDPVSGYYVFTEKYLQRRGYCCDNQCRHCPYHESILSNP